MSTPLPPEKPDLKVEGFDKLQEAKHAADVELAQNVAKSRMLTLLAGFATIALSGLGTALTKDDPTSIIQYAGSISHTVLAALGGALVWHGSRTTVPSSKE